MSYLADITAGGVDPLRDHRQPAPTALRTVRVAARVVNATEDGLTQVIDGTQDTLGDINCAGFWPKATRSISGWAFAWPAVVATGQVVTGGRPTPTTPTVTVTPSGNGRGGASVVITRSAGDLNGRQTNSMASGGVQGGGGPRSSRQYVAGGGSGLTGDRAPRPGQTRAATSSAPTSTAPAGTDEPAPIHWQDGVGPNALAIPHQSFCPDVGNGYAQSGGGDFVIFSGNTGGRAGFTVGADPRAGGGALRPGGDIFGPNIGPGGARGAVFSYGRTGGHWVGGVGYAPSNRGGTWVVGVQGAGRAYGAQFSNWSGNGPRGGRWWGNGTASAPRNRGGTWQAGVRGNRSAWGIRFRGF